MKQILAAAFLSLSMLAGPAYSVLVVAEEDFDGNSTWSNNVAASLFVDPSSSDEGLFIQAGSGGFGSGNVLFGRDLQNEGGEPDLNPLTLTFDSVDISGFTGVSVSFEYDLNGFESIDTIDYVLTFTGGTDSGTFSGDDAGLYEFDLPESAESVSLTLVLDQNGASDSFQLDSLRISALAAVPEPTAFLFGSLVAGSVGMVVARRRPARERLTARA